MLTFDCRTVDTTDSNDFDFFAMNGEDQDQEQGHRRYTCPASFFDNRSQCQNYNTISTLAPIEEKRFRHSSGSFSKTNKTPDRFKTSLSSSASSLSSEGQSKKCQNKPAPQQQQQRRKLTTHKLSSKSYVDLITEAILSTVDKRMTLADIYKWMINNVPCFKQQAHVSASCGWKNAVRHTLSLHKRFTRVQRGRLQKPAWWTISDEVNAADHGTPSVTGRSPCLNEFAPFNPFSSGQLEPDAVDEKVIKPQSAVSPAPCQFYLDDTTLVNSTTPCQPQVFDPSNYASGNWQPMKYESLSPAQQMDNSMHTFEDVHTNFAQMDSSGNNFQAGQTWMQNGLGDTQFMAQAQHVESPVAEKPLTTASSQTILVQTEKGAIKQITVPMPLRVNVSRRLSQQAQTTVQNDFNAALDGMQTVALEPKLVNNLLPQDLLGVQVDTNVRCNVAEVLAYEMKASNGLSLPPVAPPIETSHMSDLYDLLKLGCTLD